MSGMVLVLIVALVLVIAAMLPDTEPVEYSTRKLITCDLHKWQTKDGRIVCETCNYTPKGY